jgi:hypothetical protein
MKYQKSFVVRLMNQRSEDSSLEYKIILKKEIREYLDEHITRSSSRRDHAL